MLNHKKFDELLANLDMKLDLYIHGPTGSGKTVGVSNAAKKLNLPFYKKVVGSTMSESSILGYNMGHDYIEGIAYQPFVNGGILLLDEVDNGNANTNLIINGLSDGELAFPCGMRERHKDFRLVTTANTLGQGPSLNYVGRNKQDISLLNRLVFIFWPYDTQLTYDFCVDILSEGYVEPSPLHLNKFNQIVVDVEKIQQILEETKIPHIISPRSMKQAAIKVRGDRSLEEILNSVLLKGLTKEQKQRILEMLKNKRSNLEHLPKFRKPLEQTMKENQGQKKQENKDGSPQESKEGGNQPGQPQKSPGENNSQNNSQDNSQKRQKPSHADNYSQPNKYGKIHDYDEEIQMDDGIPESTKEAIKALNDLLEAKNKKANVEIIKSMREME